MIQSIVNLSGIHILQHSYCLPQSCCPSCVPYMTSSLPPVAFVSAVLAHSLFTFYFNVAIPMALEKHCQQGSGVRVAYLLDADLVVNRRIPKLETFVTDLEYTDDMALLANKWSDLTAMLDSLSTCCKKLDLTISCKKTKSLAVLPSNHQPPKVHCLSTFTEGEPIAVVSHFQYLGSIVQDDCGMHGHRDQLQDLPSSYFRTSCGINIRSRPAKLGSSTASSFQPCYMAWRALSSLSLWCTALEISVRQKKQLTTICKMAKNRGSHPSSLSAICISFGTYPGCQRKTT